MTKKVVFAFGRMNPPTTGHEKLVHKVKAIAKAEGATHHIVLSHTQDAKKNPLSVEDKVKHAKRMFPGTNISGASKEHPTMIHHLKKMHQDGVTHVTVVAGSDRTDEYKRLLNTYNGTHAKAEYNFKHINVVSAGHRDPDAEGTTGMSASKMREHAKNNDLGSFKKGLPSKTSHEHAKELFDDTRKGMKLTEGMISFRRFIGESWFKKKPKAVENTNTRWPNNHADTKGWMDREVEHHVKHDPKNLHNLFTPASGDYMPMRIHVGAKWHDDEVQKHYREIKKKHPEAVAKAKEVTTGIAGHVAMSRVGDGEDYHGVPLPR